MKKSSEYEIKYNNPIQFLSDSDIIKFRNNELKKLGERLGESIKAIEESNLSKDEKMECMKKAWLDWYKEKCNIEWNYVTSEEFEDLIS